METLLTQLTFLTQRCQGLVKKRLAITHRNVPNMVRQITKEIAEEGANIVDMLNKSRGDFAYTLD